MLYKDFPIFLDSILTCFKDNINKTLTIDEIRDIIYSKDLNKDLNGKNPSSNENLKLMTNYFFDKKDYVKFGLEFLEKEFLVNYNIIEEKVSITPSGFSKITTDSFSNEISTKRTNLWLQRATWVCTILALFISVYSLCCKKESFVLQLPCHQIHCNHESCQSHSHKDTISQLKVIR